MVIVGGGIIGGSIAFDLARRNLRVVVLDRRELMHEASWAAAGMLSLPRWMIHPAAIPACCRLGRASLALYPKFIEAVEEASGIRTGFRTGGAVEAIYHGDAEREVEHARGGAPRIRTRSANRCRWTRPEIWSLRSARTRMLAAATFLPDECSVEPRALDMLRCLRARLPSGAAPMCMPWR